MSGVNTHLTQVISKSQVISEEIRIGRNGLDVKYKAVKKQFPELAEVIKHHMKSSVINLRGSLHSVTEFFALWEMELTKQATCDEISSKMCEYEGKLEEYRYQIEEAEGLHGKNVKI